jgi:hypothetical protein
MNVLGEFLGRRQHIVFIVFDTMLSDIGSGGVSQLLLV